MISETLFFLKKYLFEVLIIFKPKRKFIKNCTAAMFPFCFVLILPASCKLRPLKLIQIKQQTNFKA